MKNRVLQLFAVICAVAMTTNFVGYRIEQTRIRTAQMIPEVGAATDPAFATGPTLRSSPNVTDGADYQDYYFVECSGAMHIAVSVSGENPAYNGIQGLIERAP